MSREQKLNRRQELFCLSMLQKKSQTQSAIDAGYAKGSADTQGSRLASNAKVIEYLAKHRKRIDDRIMEVASFTDADILGGIYDNAIEAKQLDRPDYSASNRAFELLGKHRRLFADVSEVVFTEGVKRLLDGVIALIDDKVKDESLKDDIMAGIASMDLK